MIEDNRMNLIPIFYILLVITISLFSSIEPFYTITNVDQYTREVTTNITSTHDEYSWQGHYQLEPGETVEIKKPVSLMIGWMNPFKESELFHSSSEYTYMVASGGYECYMGIEPGLSTSMSFELCNESEGFGIDVTKTHY